MIRTGNRVGSDHGLLGVTTQVSQAVLMNGSEAKFGKTWQDLVGKSLSGV